MLRPAACDAIYNGGIRYRKNYLDATAACSRREPAELLLTERFILFLLLETQAHNRIQIPYGARENYFYDEVLSHFCLVFHLTASRTGWGFFGNELYDKASRVQIYRYAT